MKRLSIIMYIPGVGSRRPIDILVIISQEVIRLSKLVIVLQEVIAILLSLLIIMVQEVLELDLLVIVILQLSLFQQQEVEEVILISLLSLLTILLPSSSGILLLLKQLVCKIRVQDILFMPLLTRRYIRSLLEAVLLQYLAKCIIL